MHIANLNKKACGPSTILAPEQKHLCKQIMSTFIKLTRISRWTRTIVSTHPRYADASILTNPRLTWWVFAAIRIHPWIFGLANTFSRRLSHNAVCKVWAFITFGLAWVDFTMFSNKTWQTAAEVTFWLLNTHSMVLTGLRFAFIYRLKKRKYYHLLLA